MPDVIEYEFRTIPQAAGSSDTAETKNRDKKAKCRNVFEVRPDLRKTKLVAAAINQRAEKARNKVQDLRRRIGFGDDRRDDLKRLEENAHRAEISVRKRGDFIKTLSKPLQRQFCGLLLKSAQKWHECPTKV